MAKDFNKFSEDNPVMSYIGKAKEEEEKQKNANAILSSMAVQKTETAEPEEKTEVKETAAVVTEQETASEPAKKTLMNINIRESTKKQWKMFFLEHDLSMTQGIETAVEYLMSEVNKGNIRLTKGGITK